MSEKRHEVEALARDRLCGSGYAELKQVTCTYVSTERVLILAGRVKSYYMKQRAQEVVKMLADVERIDNLIEVAKR